MSIRYSLLNLYFFIIFVLAMVFLLNTNVSANNDVNKISIEKYFKEYEVAIKDVVNPDEIIFTKKNGEEIRTSYLELKKSKATILKVNYSLKNGVILTDSFGTLRYKLIGKMKQHPIDDAEETCLNDINNSSTLDISHCKSITLDAWNVELIRTLNELNIANNQKLKQTYDSLMVYQNNMKDYLKEKYLSRDGTIWGIIYLGHLINLTKSHVNFLKSTNGIAY